MVDDEAARLAGRFDIPGTPRLTRHPGGHINDSWKVDCGGRSFLLQRLNPLVFTDGTAVMENVDRVSRHLLAARRQGRTRRECLELVPARSGDRWIEEGGVCWRMFVFISGAQALESSSDPVHARAAAGAFGEFAALMADLDGPPLHQTIAGFHDTARYLSLLDEAAQRDAKGRLRDAADLVDQLRAFDHLLGVVPPLIASGEIPRRIAHNDAKLSNVLFGDANRARCVTDLDTVMPGSILMDFGDMVRSMTTGVAEDDQTSALTVREDLFAAVAGGFLESVGERLVPAERAHLVDAGLLVTWEQALRFLTDYLEGDRYYRVADPEQNLRRAGAQLQLLESLSSSHARLEAVVVRHP